MKDRRLILVYPSARPLQIVGAISRAKGTTRVPVQVFLGFNGDDGNIQTGADCSHYFGPDLSSPGFIPATNWCYLKACEKFNVQPNELVGFWSDDFDPHTGWGEKLYAALDRHPSKFFLCPYDGIQEGRCATIPFATRRWWDEFNGHCIWPPIYKRFSCDDDIAVRAKMDGQFQFVRDCEIPHRHHTVHGRTRDNVDAIGEQHYHTDKQTFLDREKRMQHGERVTW